MSIEEAKIHLAAASNAIAEADAALMAPPKPKREPQTVIPYFDVGDAKGSPGDTVSIEMFAGSPIPIDGWHLCGGVGKTDEPRSGYGLFQAVGVTLGTFVEEYLKANGIDDSYFSKFGFLPFRPKDKQTGITPENPLPEEFWEYMVGFFSIPERKTVPAIPIPANTVLFTVEIEILPGTPPGKYELTCVDEYYYTTKRARRIDLLFSNANISGGATRLDLRGGKVEVL